MKKILLICTIGLSIYVQGQHAFMPLSADYDNLYAGSIYKKNVNLHTSVRALRSSEVNKVVDVDSLLYSLNYKGGFFNTWLGKVMFNEQLVKVRAEDFDLSIAPLVDFSLGRGTSETRQFANTRGLYVQGRIGKQVRFFTSFTENQARYYKHVNQFINATKVAPGLGLTRSFKEDAYDFSNAFGEVTYTPGKYFAFTLGQGRTFFGEGHRSTFISDAPVNNPYLQIQTTVWNIKYVNHWTQLLDIRNPVRINQSYRKKWVSSHYLSYNVNSRLNISFFEAVVFGSDTNNRGIDVSFFNPIIFFRPLEIKTGSDASNVILGAGASYKILDGLMAYGQLSLDEFVLAELREGSGSWRNKFAYQLGLKYLNAFGVSNFHLRAEHNVIRPYTSQHITPLTNYGHFQQPINHPWGANFRETIFQVHYRYKRYIFDMNTVLGFKGFDVDGQNYGANIYLSYNTRVQDVGNEIGQGVSTNISYLMLRVSYLLNPIYNLRIEAGSTVRVAKANNPAPQFNDNSTYLFFGMRTALFNTYFDF